MDIRHRPAFASIKIVGVHEAIVLNEGVSIAQLLPKIGSALHSAPNRYQGIDIHISFDPIGQQLTSTESMLREMISMIPEGALEMESDDDKVAGQRWAANPMNRESSSYDPLYEEYQKCSSPGHRAIKTPDDLGVLRRHMDSTYKGSEWWDGSHRW